MKNIKNWATFNENRTDFPIRDFDEITSPEKPYKRKLNKNEQKFMLDNFKKYSWSNIDAKGNIVLSDGVEEKGKYYITEKDLTKWLKQYKFEDKKEDR